MLKELDGEVRILLKESRLIELFVICSCKHPITVERVFEAKHYAHVNLSLVSIRLK